MRVRTLGAAMAALFACGPAVGGAQGRPPATDARIGLVRDPQILAALGDVSAERIRRNDSILVSFGTRNTLSDTMSSTRGIGAARRWIKSELDGYAQGCGGCLRIEYDAAVVPVTRAQNRPVNVVNVLAWIRGYADSTRVVVIGGHYDSCVCSTPNGTANDTSNAPGADDDGSGTSAVMELARVFSRRFPKGMPTSVVFALYAGEEQGTLGSRHLAERLRDAGYRIVAGMSDDIVGNVTAETGRTDSTSVRVFAADSADGGGLELLRYVWGTGQVYLPQFEVHPVTRLDRLGRGSDHGPFYRIGVPALRFVESVENYKRQHLPADLFKDVNFAYTANVARLNVAAVASLALAPATPDSALARRDTTSGGQKWALSWKPVPGAVSYEVLTRSTLDPTYTRIIPVTGTTHLLDEQLDDGWAAVRAVGRNGGRSMTRVFVQPPRGRGTTPPSGER